MNSGVWLLTPGLNHCLVQEERIGERLVKKILPNLNHSSGVQYIAACNCGRKQANRFARG